MLIVWICHYPTQNRHPRLNHTPRPISVFFVRMEMGRGVIVGDGSEQVDAGGEAGLDLGLGPD